MLKTTFIILVLTLVSFFPLSYNQLNNKLIGCWRYNKTMDIFTKVNQLNTQDFGYEFYSNGIVNITYNERANRCGNTSYRKKQNQKTFWTISSDSILTFASCNNHDKKRYLITKLTNGFLKIKEIKID